MFDAYKIGITLSLTNHVSKGLLLMAGDFAKTEAQATLLQKRLVSIQNDAIKGGLMLGAGVGMLALLKGPYEEAKKLAQAQANFQTLNLSASENAQAFGKAATMSHQTLGTTITNNVKLIHDLHTAFGDLHHAIDTADIFAKMSIVAKVANGGKDVDGLVNAAAKALEHRGGKVINNPAEFAAESDLMTKVMLATKMRVGPSDYLTASGTGKMAYQLYDKEYLYGNYAGLMSINGGARTGTAGMTAFSSLVGGHMDNKGKGFLADLGLWQEGPSKKRLGIIQEALKGLSPEERKLAVTSLGGQSALSGGLKDADAELFAHRPDLFVAKMVPLIRQRFGMDLSDEQVALLLAKNFNRNTGDFLATQITMASKLAKDTSIINKSMGNESGYQHYMSSPEGAEAAAGAAWKNFLAMFGSVYLPKITEGLLLLAKGLDSLSGFVTRNQTLVKGLVSVFAALAVGLMIRGAALLLSVALRGLGIALLMSNAGGIAGILNLSGALSFVGKALASFAIGWTIGTIINDSLIAGTKFGDWIGKMTARLLAFFGNEDAKSALKTNNGEMDWTFGSAKSKWPGGGSGFVAEKSDKPIQVNTQVNMDGRTVATMVTQHQSKAASAAPSSGLGFDSGMGLIFAGMNSR